MGSTNKRCDVLIVGRYFCDLVFTALPELPRLGHEVYAGDFHLIPGGVYNAAVALHRLETDIVWPCTFGNDPFSQFVRNAAVSEGLNTSHFSEQGHPSLHLTAAFSYQGERAFLSYSDPLPPYAYRDIITETKPRWIYITHLLLGTELSELLNAGRSVGAKFFMDCQAHNHSLSEALVQQALNRIDVFSPNRVEAEGLTAEKDMVGMLEALHKFTPVVVIKDGANGSYLKNDAGVLHEPALEIEAADTTGAGDNFDAGFLYGLVHGFGLATCLRIGNICGALSAQGIGGTSTSPREAQMLEILKNSD